MTLHCPGCGAVMVSDGGGLYVCSAGCKVGIR